MDDEKERGPGIIDAHQELVRHIEQSAGRIRILSILTVVVAAALAVSYLLQLVLPLTGTTTVTVDLTSPSNIVAELVVFALVLVWLYVGISDLRFSSRIKNEISGARSKERGIQDRIS
ncbi:MAG: hypothetical protein OK452_08045 [Thaumarchaeota archaeon]|jgi:hypothetical protein|nr:hypothetical protein [Nitrososphaerota archaeon]